LKPTLWNRFSNQARLRYLDSADVAATVSELKQQDQLMISTDRRLQSLTLVNEFQRLVELRESITNGLHWCLADAALFNSRRFRISFALYPTSCTYTRLVASQNKTSSAYFRNAVQLVTPILVNIGNVNATPEVLNAKLEKIKLNCERYLNINLELTEFIRNSNDQNRTQQKQYALSETKSRLPLLRPRSDNELIKRCSECTQEIRNSIGNPIRFGFVHACINVRVKTCIFLAGDHPDADNIEHMKSVWNLCQNLWGDIPDGLKSNPFEKNICAYEFEQIRKRLLGEWLADTSSHRIDRECKLVRFNKVNYIDNLSVFFVFFFVFNLNFL
jgi:hypothetical protein